MKKNVDVVSVGLILDGNRRWAAQNGLGKLEGHKEGVKTVLSSIDWARDFGIQHVTFYAFSTENWNRSKLEVEALLMLFESMFSEQMDLVLEKKVSVKFVGSLHMFPKKLQQSMKSIEEKTQNYEMCVYFAVSYGGRDEIVQAVKNVSKELSEEQIASLSEKEFEVYLQSGGVPDPQIIIRTGGDKRLSNFLLWKSAYAELFFINTLWPDFSKEELSAIVTEYRQKARINKGK